MSGVSASTSPPTIHSLQLNHQSSRCCLYPSSSDLKLHGIGFNGSVRWSRRTRVQCNSSSRPGGPNPGDSDTRNVLDAFFLGKALAEALNERIESTVGEFLSAIGRLQAEQQKQVQDFQEEVLERAKKTKEKAAREAMEAQGLIPKSSTANTSADSNGAASTASSSSTDATAHAKSPTTTTAESDPDPTDPVVGVSNDD